MTERAGTAIAVVLLLLAAVTAAATLVLLVLRGPPWSTAGFHTHPAARGS